MQVFSLIIIHIHVFVLLPLVTCQNDTKTDATTHAAESLSTPLITTTATTTMASKHERLLINLSALSALKSVASQPEVVEKKKDTCKSTDICATMQGICIHGKCVPLPCSEFECQCETGFIGQFCDREVNVKKTSTARKAESVSTAPPAVATTPMPVVAKEKTHVNGDIKPIGNEASNATTDKPATGAAHPPEKKAEETANGQLKKSIDTTGTDALNVTKDKNIGSIGTNETMMNKREDISGQTKEALAIVGTNHSVNQGHQDGKKVSATNMATESTSADSKHMKSGIEHISSSTAAIPTTELPSGSFRKGKEAVVLVDDTAISEKNTSETLLNVTTTTISKTNAVVLIEKESWQSRIFGIPLKEMSPVAKNVSSKKGKQKTHKTPTKASNNGQPSQQNDTSKAQKNGKTQKAKTPVVDNKAVGVDVGAIESKAAVTESSKLTNNGPESPAETKDGQLPSVLNPFLQLMNISHALAERKNTTKS